MPSNLTTMTEPKLIPLELPSADVSEDGSSVFQTRDPSPVREGSFSIVSPNSDFNVLLEKVGSFGRFQVFLLLFLVVPSAILSALVYLTQYFILIVPDHWCDINSSNFAALNSSERDKVNWIPYKLNRDGEREYSKCFQFAEHVHDPGPDIGLSSSPEKVKCSKWHYDFEGSKLYPTIATENNWVCDLDRYPYHVQTIFYVGTSIGCILFGYVADTFGRKPSIVLSCGVAGVAGLWSAFVSDFWTFAALRCLVGLTLLSFSEDPIVLSLEYTGINKRTLSIVFWVSGYIVASAVCPWLARSLANWRVLCIVTSAPLFAFIVLYKFIPESASWLLTQKRVNEAHALLRLVAKVNKRKAPSALAEPKSDVQMSSSSRRATMTSTLSEPTTYLFVAQRQRRESVIVRTARKVGALHIFLTPRLRVRSLVLGAVWFVTLCCYHTNIQNTSNLGGDLYASFTLGALVELPSIFVVLFGLDRFGRRLPMIVSTGLAGLCGWSVTVFDSNYHLEINLIMRVCLAVQYNVIIQYSAEVYPTVLRGRAIAYLRLMGTFGLYAAPTIAYLALKSPGTPFLITGSMLLVISLLSLLLPETMNEHLPHSYEEGENFGRGQKMFDFPLIGKSGNV